MASKSYSRDLLLKVARANRLIELEKQRQITGEILGDAVQMKQKEWGATALHFAQKEIKAIFGEDADKFKLKGATEAQIRKVEAAVERVLDSKMLTKSGRKEMIKTNTAAFFRKDPSEVTSSDMELLSKLDSTGLLDKLKELGYQYSHLLEALDMAKVEKREERSLTVDEKIDIIRQIVNNAGSVEEKHKREDGEIDYYGALGEYLNNGDFDQ